MVSPKLTVGTQFRYSRTISVRDIREFTAASHDAGSHHVHEDDEGRLIAHGLLVASLVTKLGGDIDFLARTMTFDFKKPSYSGDTLTCVVTLTSLVEQSERLKLKFSFTVSNQLNEIVMVGETAGMIRKTP